MAAREHLQEAVRQDSASALAHWRLGDTYGWTDGINSAGAERHRMLAARYGDRLPAREVTLLDLQGAVTTGQGIHRLQEFRAFVDRYPDDPDGWYLLGEVGLHTIGPPGMPDDELKEAIYTAVALDTSFAPYYVHALDWPIADDDSARARAFLDEWADLGPPEASLEQMRVGADLFIGDDGARAAALDRLPALSLDQLNSIYTSKLEITDHGLPMVEAVGREMGRRAGNMFTRLRIPLAQQGRFEELRELADRQPTPFTRFAARNWLFLYQWGWGLIDEDLVRATRDSLEALPQSQAPASARVVLRANFALFAGDTDGYIDVMGVADPPPALLETVGGPDGWNAMVQVFVLAERDQWEEAAGVIRDAPEICHFPNFLMACAEIARESGNTEGALEYYGGLLRWGAARSLAHYNLGRLAEERGDEATALEHYRALLLRMERADTRIPQLEWARRYVTDYVGGRGG